MDDSRTGGEGARLSSLLAGTACAVLLTPVAAAVMAAAYRFPIPLADYESGLRAAPRAAIASLFYLLLGGILVVGPMGAAASALAQHFGSGLRQRRVLWTALVFLAALLPAAALSVLDKIIGPW